MAYQPFYSLDHANPKKEMQKVVILAYHYDGGGGSDGNTEAHVWGDRRPHGC